MESLSFTTFQKISQIAKDREVVLFGAGVIAEKTVKRLNKNASLIFDNNPNLWGTGQLETEIANPKIIGTDEYHISSHLILICTTSFAEVSAQLTDLGLLVGKDFIVSPILNDLRVIADLEAIEARLLFTSGLPSEKSPNYGGGIYELSIAGDSWEYKKVYSGITYGILKLGDHYIAVDDERGLIELDQSYNIVKSAGF